MEDGKDSVNYFSKISGYIERKIIFAVADKIIFSESINVQLEKVGDILTYF